MKGKKGNLAKRIFAGIMAFAMVLTNLSLANVYAEGQGGAGDTIILNASDLEAVTLRESKEVGAFQITAASGATVVIDGNSKSMDGLSFTKRIKLGGTGDATKRSIAFSATRAASLTIYGMSSSNDATEIRTVKLFNSTGTAVKEWQLPGDKLYKLTYDITDAGSYYFASASGGANVYYMSLVYKASEENSNQPQLATMAIETEPETYSFYNTKTVFGQESLTEAAILSANNYILLEKGENASIDATTNGHGLNFEKPVKFTVIVPAESKGVLSFAGCQYASSKANVKAGATVVAENYSMITTNENDTVIFSYNNETSEVVQLVAELVPSGRGYVHGVTYDVEELPAKNWDAEKTGKVTVGDTVFSVSAAVTESAGVVASVESGNGYVEVQNGQKAVVWANYGAASLLNSVTAGEGIASATVSGNQITLSYADQETLPEGFVLEVRNSGAAVTPESDGKIFTYDLTAKKIVSDLYEGGNKVASGKILASEDGLLEIRSAGGVYYKDTQYGIATNANDAIAIKVAGDATVKFNVASFGTTGIAATAEQGSVYFASDETKQTASADTTNVNPGEVTFKYEGKATTLVFTFTGGTSYVKSVEVKNLAPTAPEGVIHPEAATVIPSLINWDNGKLEASVAGQKITLSNSTKIVKTNIKTSGLGIYAFPATTDNNTLSVDLVVGECASSTDNAVMVGLFNVSADDDNGIRAITTGIRSNNHEVVQLMSKKTTEVLGKNSFNNAVMSAGDVINVTISRDGKNIIQTFTNKTKGTATAEKKTAYTSAAEFKNPGGEVYYGLMIANKDAVVTNMVYTDSTEKVLYDQNTYYDPVGTAPKVTAVSGVAAEDRTNITLDWTADKAMFDAKYVLQVKKPGASDFEDVATELTKTTYSYPVGAFESGLYTFRVCGTLGNSQVQNVANRNTWVESEPIEIAAALEKPELTLSYVSAADKVVLGWSASAGAESYNIYRRYDNNEAVKIANVETTGYVDEAVEAEVPYYYSVEAISSDNFSPKSDEKWTLTTNGHSGDFDENVTLAVTSRSYNTVFENKISLEGIAGAAGTVKLYVNDTLKASKTVSSANGSFSFINVEVAQGRNVVELVLEYGNGKKLRKALNFVYLTKYDIVVDDDFAGIAGAADANGIPQYKTVAEALDSISASNAQRKVILVKNGEYNEQLVINKPNVSIIGEDSEKTHIYFASCNDKMSGSSRYAVSVMAAATNFTAENIAIENTWEYVGLTGNESAEALYCEADKAIFVGVRLLSFQDTLQSKCADSKSTVSQYFLRCYIAGNVDYMWGQRTKPLFEDCDFVFRYNANKNSGYYTAFGPDCQAIYNNCRFTAEDNCGGSKYYLGRPYNNTTAVAFIDCYMGEILNRDWGYATWGGKELSTDTASYDATAYYESGTYGAGYAVNINRRQISKATATKMVSTSGLGWDPYTLTTNLSANNYVGTISTPVNNGTVEDTYESDKYSPYESNDTGLGKYQLEGYAQSVTTTGGGLLKETSENYYKVTTGDEFLAALKKAYDKKGVPSVIEITSDSISLGIKEINSSYETLYGSSIVAPHNAALLSPVLKESGISKVYIKGMSNLTIFSKNGATIKHGCFDINNSSNIIIRNVDFDECWEWDEETAGDYDVNDWDYMTIEAGSNRVWVDHCTFYKSYDGVVDIKTSASYATPMNITISWCEFLPGSENNEFFNAQMEYLYENRSQFPYYNSLLKSGMSKEQIWWYAYGQKKTHLLGQDDGATANENLRVTFANNYYFDSMDRMPRLRFGTAHVYNCIMDSQQLLDARNSITNKDAAKHIISNGAASTCDGKVLLENCYINGIQNALNSGNGSSPSGYIAAKNTLYYVDGIRYAAIPKVNTTKPGEPLKVTDANVFISALPYTDYVLYDAVDLATVVKPYTGAGKLTLSTLQWEKGSYEDAQFEKPAVDADYDKDNSSLNEYVVPEEKPSAPVVEDEPSKEEPKQENKTEKPVYLAPDTTANVIVEAPASQEVKNITEAVANDDLPTKLEDTNLASAIELTNFEKAAGVWVWAEVNSMETATVPAQDLKEIQKNIKKDTVAFYFDVNLFKQVPGANKTGIKETKEKLTFSMKLPEEMNIKGRYYAVVRVHDGVYEQISEFAQAINGEISFKTDAFSTYAVIYTDKPAAVRSPKTGENTNALWLLLFAMGVMCVALPVCRRGFTK